MEDIFNIIATNYSDSFDGSLTPEVMDDSIARANDFFDLGGRLGFETETSSPLNFEGTDSFVEDSYHFEDQVFNPTSFVELGFTGQDSLDLLITHEGTGAILNDMDVHFDGFQEELCSDYVTGVRAGLAGMDVSQIESALADISQESGHANGDFRAEAFSEGVAFANEFMETHGQPPTFNDCLEGYNNGHMQNLADLARLEDQLFAQECEMAHYQHLAEEQPDNEMAQQQYQESEARCREMRSELEQKRSEVLGDNSSLLDSTESSRLHSRLIGEGYHPTFGYKDGLYTKEEIEAHMRETKNEFEHQKSRIAAISKKISHETHLEHPSKAKLDSLKSDMNDATRKMEKAAAENKAWSNTVPNKQK